MKTRIYATPAVKAHCDISISMFVADHLITPKYRNELRKHGKAGEK